ncbi:MAG: hypothetical protein JXR73_10385 [Candidatus Omnitrophica bacterium]|nr:hypothetical protein [Candidatus Omnitrophota bacterium]
MSGDSLTLVLNGEITLQDYAKAIFEFQNLVNALNDDFSPDHTIEWKVDELDAGSARSSFVGIANSSQDAQTAEKIKSAFEKVGENLRRGDVSMFSKNVQSAVKGLVNLINGRIPSIRFETDAMEWEIFDNAIIRQQPDLSSNPIKPIHRLEAFGAVKGRVQTLNREKFYRFNLYDLMEHRSITCRLSPEFEEQMRNVWGKVVIVEGLVRRDQETGKPTSVREIKSIIPIEEGTPGGWRKAMGCAPHYTGGVPSEDAIRKLRDD